MVFSLWLWPTNEIDETKNAGKSTTILMTMVMQAVVQRGTHHPMEHIRGFTRSHWMPPSGEYLHRFAPTAAMVDKLE